MPKTIATEITKAQKNGAQVGNGFTKSKIRQGLNTLRDGDIIEFPTDLTGKVITEQMKRRGEPVFNEVTKDDGTVEKVPAILEYMFVDVERNGNKTVVQFYPSSFTKSRELAKDGVGTGTYDRADGDVVDLFTSFDEDDVDKALLAIAQKGKVKVNLRTIDGIEFGTGKAKKMTIPTFSWAV